MGASPALRTVDAWHAVGAPQRLLQCRCTPVLWMGTWGSQGQHPDGGRRKLAQVLWPAAAALGSLPGAGQAAPSCPRCCVLRRTRGGYPTPPPSPVPLSPWGDVERNRPLSLSQEGGGGGGLDPRGAGGGGIRGRGSEASIHSFAPTSCWENEGGTAGSDSMPPRDALRRRAALPWWAGHTPSC